MKLKHLFFFSAFLSFVPTTQAQKLSVISDSLWCEHLDEIIKCASLDLITDRISKTVTDSTFIPPFTPDLRLTNSPSESIKKEYGKVNYECYLYNSDKLDDKLEKRFTQYHQKLKACLSAWDDARLRNGDPTLSVPDDYFLTNSEDETTARLDIVRDHGYHIRLRIY
jgi:hypothetical protein